jgi:acetamidase/formamidase
VQLRDARLHRLKRYGYEPIDAYMLCSVCADLRISSIVDVPKLGGFLLLSAGGDRIAKACAVLGVGMAYLSAAEGG